jgi:hypothetical protein
MYGKLVHGSCPVGRALNGATRPGRGRPGRDVEGRGWAGVAEGVAGARRGGSGSVGAVAAPWRPVLRPGPAPRAQLYQSATMVQLLLDHQADPTRNTTGHQFSASAVVLLCHRQQYCGHAGGPGLLYRTARKCQLGSFFAAATSRCHMQRPS